MVAVLLSVVAAYGVYLIYTSAALGWRGFGTGPSSDRHRRWRRRVHDSLAQAGLEDARTGEVVSMVVASAVVAGTIAYALFGGVAPAVAAGVFGLVLPVASYRQRREHRRSEAREAWPRLIEEMRLLAGSLGRSIPQALFEVRRRAPREMQPAFDAAHREWMISTDFARTLAVLKAALADPTADATCETLLVAHEIGGSDLDRRLAALVEDRLQDLHGRKDARAKQAGVRFARRFVLLVPIGMTLAGASIGTGRHAYATPLGQAAVVVGIACTVACWVWAGRLLRLPEEERVFYEEPA